ASVESDYGQARSAWSRDGERLRLDVDVPVNAVAEVHVPRAAGQAVFEDGRPAASQQGVRLLREEAGAVVYEVGSGSYRFLAATPGPGGREPREPPRRGDRTAPRIDGLKVVPARVVAGRSATVRWSLSEPAVTRIAVQQRVDGWRRGKQCVIEARAVSKRARAAAKREPAARRRAAKATRGTRCHDWREVRAATVAGRNGANRWTLDSRRMASATHRVVLVAADAAGNRSRERYAGFTVTQKKQRKQR
ncbi:MAG TPA: alpha-L-rhamnosidase C-terminal domain-containing protein, partial [Conexibacter sp.]|nr:alpha-L-rhamnosidase C-terminal domain-containing protein [Conexibacter sp.]